MNILQYPHEILDQTAEIVTDRELALELLSKLKQAIDEVGYGNPVGMAAPQIGEPYRAFIALGKFYLNPIIVHESSDTYTSIEGCYSLTRHKQYKVERHDSIRIVYLDDSLSLVNTAHNGFEATVIQHELDHCLGRSADHPGVRQYIYVADKNKVRLERAYAESGYYNRPQQFDAFCQSISDQRNNT